VSLQVPQGWKVTHDAASESVTAVQDPSRPGSPQLWIHLPARVSGNADQMIDAALGQLGSSATVAKRERLPDGSAAAVVLDVTHSGAVVRMGAIAVVRDGVGAVAVFAAQPTEFEQLGGAQLAGTVLVATNAAAAAPTATSPQPTPDRSSPADSAQPSTEKDPLTTIVGDPKFRCDASGSFRRCHNQGNGFERCTPQSVSAFGFGEKESGARAMAVGICERQKTSLMIINNINDRSEAGKSCEVVSCQRI